tara:strand:+ start:3883 stop:5466 length:1584 start_codon:yes stop_codon:yes gene_type:complete
MASTNPKKQYLIIAVVLAVGLVLAGLMVRDGEESVETDAHGQESNREDAAGHDDEERRNGSSATDGADPEHQEGDGHQEALEAVTGPKGGKLFTKGDYGVEVTIFEEGADPEFRVYTYFDGELLDPAKSTVEMQLHRLGQDAQVIQFTQMNDYLLGDQVVFEPHSFRVDLDVQYGESTFAFSYEQVEARVTLSDAQLEQGGVSVATAGPATIASLVQTLGEVRYNNDNTVQVVPQLSGRVTSVSANAGDKVRKGQVLATVTSRALATVRGELLAAQKRSQLAQRTFDRERQLWKEKISAEQDFLQAQLELQEANIAVQRLQEQVAWVGGSAAVSLTEFGIISPIDGVITEKKISVGEIVNEASSVFTVSDLSSVWIETTVSAKDLGAIAEGQRALVSASAFSATAEGHISYISALVGAQSRSAVARIVLDNADGIWRPGLLATVDIVTDETTVPVAVSTDAVQTIRDWSVVFGRFGSFFEARPVELGRTDGRFIEVLSGLKPGDQYAQDNSFLVKAELGKAGASHDH